jgi:hypothetical protein
MFVGSHNPILARPGSFTHHSLRTTQGKGYPRIPALEREHHFIRALDFVFGLQKFVAPWFAGALGALVDGAANSETVIARSFGTGAGELLASLAGLEELVFERSVLIPQFVFTDDAHALLLSADLLPEASGSNPPRSGGHRSGLQDPHAVSWDTG